MVYRISSRTARAIHRNPVLKNKIWILWFFLEGGIKDPQEEIQKQSVEQSLRERPYRICST